MKYYTLEYKESRNPMITVCNSGGGSIEHNTLSEVKEFVSRVIKNDLFYYKFITYEYPNGLITPYDLQSGEEFYKKVKEVYAFDNFPEDKDKNNIINFINNVENIDITHCIIYDSYRDEPIEINLSSNSKLSKIDRYLLNNTLVKSFDIHNNFLVINKRSSEKEKAERQQRIIEETLNHNSYHKILNLRCY